MADDASAARPNAETPKSPATDPAAGDIVAKVEKTTDSGAGAASPQMPKSAAQADDGQSKSPESEARSNAFAAPMQGPRATSRDHANAPPILSIDAMSGDLGADVVVAALKRAKIGDARVILHGDAAQLYQLTADHHVDAEHVEIRQADAVVSMEETPRQALRLGESSSMARAIETVVCAEADVVISAGNTAALVAMAAMRLRPVDGLERPSIAALWPSVGRNQFNVVLDVGATLSADSDDLVAQAAMGAEYARAALRIARPRIALLNVGVEETKGQTALRRAAARLRDISAGALDAEFAGFIEGDQIAADQADVIVTDGFSGNVALKTAEGVARQISNYLKATLAESTLSRIGALMASPSLARLKQRIDPRQVNGGVLLGLNGLVVKSHGAADAIGVAAAIELASRIAKDGLAWRIGDRIRNLGPGVTDADPDTKPDDHSEQSVAL